jgi:predicted dehydrogenase
MTNNKLHFAIIGCGYWGPNFIRILHQMDNVVLKSVCDIHPQQWSLHQAKHPAIHFTVAVDDIVNDSTIDAVVICTPVSTHFELCKKFLVAGKHVLCEKPLSDNVNDCTTLAAVAEQNKKMLMVGHIFEYNSVIQYMKDRLQQGSLGKLHYLQFTRMGLGPVRNDVSVLYDLASHDISLAISFIGHMPIAVTASGSWFIQENIEDVAFIQLEFPNKIMVSINVSWLDPIKQRLIKIVGEREMLLFNDVSISEKLRIVTTGKNYQTSTGDFGGFQLSVKDGEIIIPNIPHPEPLITEIEHFIHAIHTNTAPLTNGAYACNVAKVLDAAQLSMKQNGLKVQLT